MLLHLPLFDLILFTHISIRNNMATAAIQQLSLDYLRKAHNGAELLRRLDFILVMHKATQEPDDAYIMDNDYEDDFDV